MNSRSTVRVGTGAGFSDDRFEPARYITPDCVLDITDVEFAVEGNTACGQPEQKRSRARRPTRR
jgi:hypothetical protein